jgi:hypothetical protein
VLSCPAPTLGRYGPVFLTETLAHHMARTDFKHNFSVWFLPQYLAHAFPPAVVAVKGAASVVQVRQMARIACVCLDRHRHRHRHGHRLREGRTGVESGGGAALACEFTREWEPCALRLVGVAMCV